MNWYKLALAKEEQTALFRGDEKPLDLDQWEHGYATKTLGKELSSSMANGPGIYFSISEKNAGQYGSNITKKTLQNANIVTKSHPKFTYKQIDKILQKVNKERLELAASNWDENYNIGKNALIKSILNANNATDQLMLIWSDVFYHQNPNEFIQLMVNNGIDGIAVVIGNAANPDESDTHYIIYNKNVLR